MVFRSGCFVRSALFHADCSRRSSCFRYCLFEESVDHHSRCWCICGSLFFLKKSVRSRLSVGAFVVRCFFSKKSVRSPLSVGAFVVRCCSSTLGWRVCGSICVRTAQSVALHRCQMPRGHAPARFRSESSVRAVVVDESLTVCASDMSLGETTCEESGLNVLSGAAWCSADGCRRIPSVVKVPQSGSWLSRPDSAAAFPLE